MKISVQSVGVTPHQPLVEFMETKLAKLSTFYDDILEVKVFLKAENATEKENKTVELIVHIPGDEVVVKKTTDSFEKSLDEAKEAAKRLLIKCKEKKAD